MRSPDFWGPLLVVMLYAVFVIKFSVRSMRLPDVSLTLLAPSLSAGYYLFGSWALVSFGCSSA